MCVCLKRRKEGPPTLILLSRKTPKQSMDTLTQKHLENQADLSKYCQLLLSFHRQQANIFISNFLNTRNTLGGFVRHLGKNTPLAKGQHQEETVPATGE